MFGHKYKELVCRKPYFLLTLASENEPKDDFHKMKKTLFCMLLATSCVAMAQKPIKVQGIIENSKEDMNLVIHLEKNMGHGDLSDNGDTIRVRKGKFSYEKNLTGITLAWIGGGEFKGVMPCNVLLVPGEKLRLTLKGEEFFYGGSKIYQECNATDLATTPYYKDFSEYYEKALNTMEKIPESEREAMARKMEDTLRTKMATYNEKLAEYLDTHTSSEGAMLYLSQNVGAEDVYKKMSEDIRQGRVGQYLKAQMDHQAVLRAQQEKAAAEEAAKLEAMKSSPAKDFTLKDLKGNDLSLSSLRGKYVVLDFWGSWCGWCIKGIPEMKKYYEKYAGKFEILGIDCNDSDAAWRKAVEQYELPWLHVYNPRESSVLSDYAIQGFPTKIIIDPEGRIAEIVVGESQDFYDFLDKIFGN